MRFIAWITAACALSVGATFLILGLGPLAGGVWIAVAAAVVLVAELVNAVRKDRDDKLRRGREAEWQRRIAASAPRFADLKPWPVGDDEVRS